MDFPELTEARVVTIRPGDVVVLRSANLLTRELAASLEAEAERAFNCPVVVLYEFQIDVIRQEG